MRRFVVQVLVLALIVIGIRMLADTEPKVDCGGPTVSTPLIVRSLQVGAGAGDLFHDLITDGASPWEVVRAVRMAGDTVGRAAGALGLGGSTLGRHMEGQEEPTAATGWRVHTAEAQAALLASCCPTAAPPQPVDPLTPPGQGGGEPFDPKQASFDPGLKGAALAAAAAQAAGFPADQVPMAVAVARYESTFDPHPPTNPAMRGMWQINWAAHPELHGMGDAYDPYVNARMAYSIWKAAGSWSPWSTASTARQHLGEYNQYGQGATRVQPLPNAQAAAPGVEPPAVGVPVGCPAGGVTGTGMVQQVAALDPAGAGNWQTMAKDGAHWYVGHARAGDREQVVHRLNAAGVEVDQMRLPGFDHMTGMAVIKGTVYASKGGRVLAVPYRGGGTATTGKATRWRGQVSLDPASHNLVVRNGNHYQAYTLAGAKVGREVVTPRGARQGFSLSGTTLHVLTGATNGPINVYSWSITTGLSVGSQPIPADVGAGRYREAEGMFGGMFGVKTGTGSSRRLKVFTLPQPTTPQGPVDVSGLPGAEVMDGKRVSRVAAAQIRFAEGKTGTGWQVMQGGYGGGHVAASGTSHNYPGVVDVACSGAADCIAKEQAARQAGFAAWARNVAGRSRVGSGEHVHAVSLLDPADAASPQITGSWARGEDGLNGGHDPAPHYAWWSDLTTTVQQAR